MADAYLAASRFFLVDDQTKPFVAEVPDIIYVDVPDRDGWDKMAEF